MRINSKLGVQHAAFDGAGAGEGLSIFLSQNAEDLTRYRFLVKAMLSEGVYQVGTFYSSPPQATTPNGQLTRMVAAAVCPGATSWAVDVSAVPPVNGSPINPETAELILSSSRCCTAPVGVSRVDERYGYIAGVTTLVTQYAVLPGQTITRIVARNPTGFLGAISLNGGGSIPVPAGGEIALQPKVAIPFGAAALTMLNVDWCAEFLESA